ncbi:MAG: hypothetical protein WB439_16375 [Acidobacteriaceae bacterium]
MSVTRNVTANVARCTGFVVLIAAAGLLGSAFGGAAWAQVRPGAGGDQAEVAAAIPVPASPVATNPVSAHPRETYPQIVRLSLVQGDVRVAVGKVKGQSDVGPWVEGAVNMPLETGFSVVTGKGRAEIEFEDASTMYVGENSALAFDVLTTKDGVPDTEMTLLTGVAVLDLHPNVRGESYLLETPSDYIHVPYGRHASLRINSYTDTATLTPLLFGKGYPGEKVSPLIGKTFTFDRSHLEPAPPDPTKNTDVAFDAWATSRIEARSAAMHAVMQDAGLSEPEPGLADMKAKGTFFACKPYGTCWVPTNGWGAAHAAGSSKGAVVPVSAQMQGPASQQMQTQQAPTQQQMQDAKLAQRAQRDEEEAEEQTSGGVAPAVWVEDEDLFPCSPYGVEDLMGQDPVTGDVTVLDSQIVWGDDGFDGYGYGGYGFDWAVCHTGSWIYRRHRYVWVAGRHHHHHSPVRWVKVNGKRGYVPIHPRDVAGKEPFNLRHGIFMQKQQKVGGDVRRGGGVVRVAYDPGSHVKVLGDTPRGYRGPVLQGLRASRAPTLEARSLTRGTEGSKAISPTSLIEFDSRARGFTVTTRMSEGGRSHTVVDHFGGGISGGSHGFGGGGGRAFSGGSGSSGGHFGGGGGGAHFGGGGSSGGGGSHGGGSAPAASSSGGGTSSGGGHAH